MARKRFYKTNKGKEVDIEAVRAANEKTIASGNMNVNTKGDEVQGGKVIRSAKERVAPHYQNRNKQVARTSIKPPIRNAETKVNTQQDGAEAEEQSSETANKDPVVSIKTRDNGTQYKEILYPDGNIEVEEISPDTYEEKPKPTKKKTKKSTKRSPPTV